LDTDKRTGQTDEEAKALKYKAIEEKLSKAIVLAPYDADLRFDRASAREELGDFEGALEDLNFVIETTSDADTLVSAYWGRIVLDQSAGRSEELLNDLNWLIEHRVRDSDYSWRASELVKRGRITEAITDLTMAFSLNPFDLSYLYRRARLYYSLMEYGKAIHDCTTIIKIKEKCDLQFYLQFHGFDWVYYLRAQAYFMIEEIDWAISDAFETRKLRDQPGYKSLEDFMDEFGYLRKGLAG
jgi:tetratricopeptide (TPR) repeat protein